MNIKIIFILSLIIVFNNYHSKALVTQNSIQENVIFLGASNTAEEISSVPRNGSFITVLRTLNSDWEKVNLVDKAISGWRASNFYGDLDLLNETVFDFTPDYIVIVLGGNDFLSRMSPERFEIRYKWLLDAIIFLDSNSLINQIFIANIFWGTIDLGDNLIDDFQSYQELIRNASNAYNFPILDFFNVTQDHPEYYVDPIHLNDQGHIFIANEVNRVVKTYINGSSTRSERFSDITDLYSNDYTRNSPGFGLISTSVTFVLILLYYRPKNLY